MQQDDKAILIYSTFPSLEEAERVGAALVEAALAACVNILPGMTSLYRWQGKLERSSETVMIVKTMASQADRVMAFVRKRHSYSNPALLVLPVIAGAPSFLEWIATETETPRQ